MRNPGFTAPEPSRNVRAPDLPRSRDDRPAGLLVELRATASPVAGS